MRAAHLIITYTDPKLTERMIKRMSHPDFDFYIHVDKKCDIKRYSYLGDLPNTYFVEKRVDVRWAGYSTMRAVFNGVKEICKSGRSYDFINLLSGQDYPLKSVEELVSFFEENKGKEFVASHDMYGDWEHELFRIERYHLMDVRLMGRRLIGQITLEGILNSVFGKRKIPYNLHPYGQSTFWMLSPEVAHYVVKTVETDWRLKRFFYFTWASDEILFQMIILNSPYKERVINNNYRYIDWSEKKANPKTFDISDFDKLKDTDSLFARKFDMAKDAQIIDRIDEMLDSRIINI